MKRTWIAFGALVLAAAFASAKGLPGLDQSWQKEILAGDAGRLAALYAENAVFYPPDTMEVKGREAIRKYYEALLGAFRVAEAKLTAEKYETHGDTSVGWGRFSLRLVPRTGGDPTVMEGRFTEVAKKVGGQWLYVADHASAPPPPQPAPTPAGK